MKYIVRISALGKYPELDLTKDEYAELAEARGVLVNIMATEEKYELLLSKYREFENKCLEVANLSMTRAHSGYSGFFDARLEINIKIVNLLTAARLYNDQLETHVKACCPSIPDADVVAKRWRADAYDQSSSYRFMEALRNYVQHRGLPVHLVRRNSKWTSLDENGRLEFTTHVYASRTTLAEDGQFKKSVLEEIGENVDLVEAARGYLESLSAIQNEMRVYVSSSVDVARRRIEAVHKGYETLYNDRLVGLSAEVWADGELREAIPLLLDWDDIRIELQKRNTRLVNLSKRRVTSKVASDT